MQTKTAHKKVERKTAQRPSTAKKPAMRKPDENDWRHISAAVKHKWESISDADLKFVDHNMEALINKVRERTGLERDTAERQLDELIGPLTLLPREVVKPKEAVAKA